MNELMRSAKESLLARVLHRNQVDASRFSLNGYKDEAVCIEPVGRKWVVYDGERGRQHNPEYCSAFEVAGYRLISRLSESDEMEKTIISSYIISITKQQTQPQLTHTKQSASKPSKKVAGSRKSSLHQKQLS